MEAQGTGGMGLEPRVNKLEHAVERQTDDLKHLSGQVTDVKADITGVSESQKQQMAHLRDIAEKLDATRMKRPDLHGSVALVSLLVVIASLALTPLYVNQTRLMSGLSAVGAEVSDRAESDAKMLGRYESDREAIDDRLSALEDFKDRTSESRFTIKDGQRLEDKVDRYIEREQ